jgi:3-oxoacyl-[acyl-carrier protein] reductase
MSNDRLLVLGGSSDIALALVDRIFASDPTATAVAQFLRSSEVLEARRATYGPRLEAIRCDLSDPEAVQSLVAQFRQAHGIPRAIVHLAGLKLRLERFTKWDAAHVENDMRVQVLSIVTVLRAFLPEMAKAAHRTKVVFVLSSVTRGVPPKFLSMYTVVKSAQLGLMRALAAEYASTSVNINAISPAMVQTKFLSDLPERAVELAASRAVGGRLLAPSDVADVIAFLLSPASDHLSGIEIPVTDGTFV